MWEVLGTPVGQRALVWVLVALIAGPSLAGCLSDLQRQRLDVAWEPELTVHQAPAVLVDGWPAMVQVEGTVTIDAAVSVELTGVEASLEQGERSLSLDVIRLSLGERSLRGSDLADTEPALASGTPVRATLLPAPDQAANLTTRQPVNVSLELQWRYREDQRFDAGRLQVQQNVTVASPPGLGLGAVQKSDGAVTSLIFGAIGDRLPSQTQAAEVFAIGGDGPVRLGPSQMSFEAGEGVALARLAQPVETPDGHGYLVFILKDGPTQGTVVHTYGEPEQTTPGPAAWLTLVGMLGAALFLSRRARGGGRLR